MLRRLAALLVLFTLAGCGGGSSGSSSSTAAAPTSPAPVTPAPLANFVAVSVDQGPAVLQTGANPYTQSNVAYASVTLCAPGSATNCQTIDHIQVDTGSVGLRIFGSALNSTLLSALPSEADASANPVGECYQYVDGYVFGSVRTTDFTIGGEKVANMPFQVLADSGQFSSVPASCSAGGGSNIGTIQDFGSNGIIGIATTTTDCERSANRGVSRRPSTTIVRRPAAPR